MRFHCYAVGDNRASVCTDLTDAVATAQLNLEEPDASGPWVISGESFGRGILADGTEVEHVPNGTACPDGLAGCRHLLFTRAL